MTTDSGNKALAAKTRIGQILSKAEITARATNIKGENLVAVGLKESDWLELRGLMEAALESQPSVLEALEARADDIMNGAIWDTDEDAERANQLWRLITDANAQRTASEGSEK